MPIMSVSTLRPTLSPAGLRAPAAGPRGSKRPSAVAARGSSTRNHKSVAALGCGKSPVPPLVLQTLVAATAFSLCAALAVPDAAIAALSKPLPGSASVFVGEFSDPKHPGCLRSIGVGEDSAFDVKGTDGSPGCLNGEKQRPWSLKGDLVEIPSKAPEILIDFTPKGGPKNLLGKWTGTGILFPDGNEWKKLSAQ